MTTKTWSIATIIWWAALIATWFMPINGWRIAAQALLMVAGIAMAIERFRNAQRAKKAQGRREPSGGIRRAGRRPTGSNY